MRSGVYLSASDLGDDHRFTSMVHVDYPHPPHDSFHSLGPSLSFCPPDKPPRKTYPKPGGGMFENPENIFQTTWKSSPKLVDLYQNLEVSRMTSLPPTMTWAAENSVTRPRRQLPKVPEGSAATERANRLVSYDGDMVDVGLGVFLASSSSMHYSSLCMMVDDLYVCCTVALVLHAELTNPIHPK